MNDASLKGGNAGAPVAGNLENEVKASLVGGRLPCVAAFKVAEKLKVSRGQVGEMANALGLRIVDCQLGCFGTKKATHTDITGKEAPKALAEKVKSASNDGELPCAAAFKVAGQLKVTPKEVGDAATLLKIRIVRCQLGCFP
ncbi:MAG: hypothetical protein HY671_13000 [Chloroflexi bacterium]|nr:hypothetical protein [Chloroflexota bacterium]